MKIIIPGGSGQVGTMLARSFSADGHEVVVLSRGRRPLAHARNVEWDGESIGAWTDELEGADAVINLAGRSVNCRYTPHNRRLITESRVRSARIIGRALAAAKRPPPIWLQASTATIYAHTYGQANDEASGVIGDEAGAPETWRFSIEVATAWEAAARETPTPRTRLVLLRSAMTMSPDPGGIFSTLLNLARFGFGGPAGDGRQYLSWIHERDFVRAMYWLIEHEWMEGPVNVAAPHPLPNAAFMRVLREAANIPYYLPAPEWLLELGAPLIRTETELILKSRRVVPARLVEAGFTFEFPTWRDAAVDLCGRRRAATSGKSNKESRIELATKEHKEHKQGVA